MTWLLPRALKYAPVIALFIATVGGGIAWGSLLTTRATARKRAAMDLFFKTEMDKTVVDAYAAYDKAVDILEAELAATGSTPAEIETAMDSFSKRDEYDHICTYLNIHELISVGIRTGVLDKKVCYEFWSDELVSACRNCMPVIEHAKTHGTGSLYTYYDLVRLSGRWAKRLKKEKLNAERQKAKAISSTQPLNLGLTVPTPPQSPSPQV